MYLYHLSILRRHAGLHAVGKFQLFAGKFLLSVDDLNGPEYMDGVGSNRAADSQPENHNDQHQHP